MKQEKQTKQNSKKVLKSSITMKALVLLMAMLVLSSVSYGALGDFKYRQSDRNDLGNALNDCAVTITSEGNPVVVDQCEYTSVAGDLTRGMQLVEYDASSHIPQAGRLYLNETEVNENNPINGTQGIHTEGAYYWFGDNANGKIHKITTSGVYQNSIDAVTLSGLAVGTSIDSISGDATYIYTSMNAQIYAFRKSDNKLDGNLTFNPSEIAFPIVGANSTNIFLAERFASTPALLGYTNGVYNGVNITLTGLTTVTGVAMNDEVIFATDGVSSNNIYKYDYNGNLLTTINGAFGGLIRDADYIDATNEIALVTNGQSSADTQARIYHIKATEKVDYTGTSINITETDAQGLVRLESGTYLVGDEADNSITGYNLAGATGFSFTPPEVGTLGNLVQFEDSNGNPSILTQDSSTNTIRQYEIDLVGGTGTFTGFEFNHSAGFTQGITYDGHFIYVVEYAGNVYEYEPVDGNYTGETFIPNTNNVFAVTNDNENLWIHNLFGEARFYLHEKSVLPPADEYEIFGRIALSIFTAMILLGVFVALIVEHKRKRGGA